VLREQARLLEPLGVLSEEPVYRLEAARLGDTRERVAAKLPARFIALHPFAAARDRCVSLGEWTQLAFHFHGHGLPALWVGLPHELEELRRAFTHPPGFYSDHLADGSLAPVAAALSLATLFVGHDSGPLHVAGAFGVPVVGVFAPGQPRRTFPQGVGPSRILARAAAHDITAAMLIHEAEALGIFSSA
jgi:ADP-heptose:LPS heptosyltransferase